jgi:hypothetical protein
VTPRVASYLRPGLQRAGVDRDDRVTDDTTMGRHTAASISPELLAAFREPGFEPLTVTIAGLVTVRMDARYQVVEMLLHHRNAESAQVQVALKEAFNEPCDK